MCWYDAPEPEQEGEMHEYFQLKVHYNFLNWDNAVDNYVRSFVGCKQKFSIFVWALIHAESEDWGK